MAAAGPPPQDDSSSDEEAQAFYVGGSDHSGQQVLGPKKKKKNASFVDRVLESVRTHAEEVDPSTVVKTNKPNFFSGAGRRLGETVDDSPEVPPEARPPSPREFALRMWQDGFSIDDGPLRPYDEPESRRFLEFVSRGQIPPELTTTARGGEVTVNMEDKRGEAFRAPKQARAPAFTGEGRTLGSISPTTVGMTAETTETDKKANEETAKKEVKLNTSEPTTNIQLRLADGSRLVAQFNHTHTIRDVRMFIVRARPQYEICPFSLMTAFPSQELTDEMATLKDLNLLNAVIIQRVTG